MISILLFLFVSLNVTAISEVAAELCFDIRMIDKFYNFREL